MRQNRNRAGTYGASAGGRRGSTAVLRAVLAGVDMRKSHRRIRCEHTFQTRSRLLRSSAQSLSRVQRIYDADAAAMMKLTQKRRHAGFTNAFENRPIADPVAAVFHASVSRWARQRCRSPNDRDRSRSVLSLFRCHKFVEH